MLSRLDLGNSINSMLGSLRDFFSGRTNVFLGWLFNLPLVKEICALAYMITATVAFMCLMIKTAVLILQGVAVEWASMIGTTSGNIGGASGGGGLAHSLDVLNYIFPLTEGFVFLFAYMSWCVALFGLKAILTVYKLIPFKAT